MSDNLPSTIRLPEMPPTSAMPAAPELMLFLSPGWFDGRNFGYADGTRCPEGAERGYVAWLAIEPRRVEIRQRMSHDIVSRPWQRPVFGESDYTLSAVIDGFSVAYGTTVASAVQTAMEGAETERRRRGW